MCLAKTAWTFTVLRELGGAEKTGDPEGLFGPLQALIVGRQVDLGEGQLQVARAVGQAGVLLALGRKTHILRGAVNQAVISGLSCGAVTDS